jgi:hypothetical protein
MIVICLTRDPSLKVKHELELYEHKLLSNREGFKQKQKKIIYQGILLATKAVRT